MKTSEAFNKGLIEELSAQTGSKWTLDYNGFDYSFVTTQQDYADMTHPEEIAFRVYITPTYTPIATFVSVTNHESDLGKLRVLVSYLKDIEKVTAKYIKEFADGSYEPIPADLPDKIRDLTQGVDVDLNASLNEDDE